MLLPQGPAPGAVGCLGHSLGFLPWALASSCLELPKETDFHITELFLSGSDVALSSCPTSPQISPQPAFSRHQPIKLTTPGCPEISKPNVSRCLSSENSWTSRSERTYLYLEYREMGGGGLVALIPTCSIHDHAPIRVRRLGPSPVLEQAALGAEASTGFTP